MGSLLEIEMSGIGCGGDKIILVFGVFSSIPESFAQ